jgi:sugar phosphate isomerase/epimerase
MTNHEDRMQSNSEFSRRALLAVGAASATVAFGAKVSAVLPVEFVETAKQPRPKICIFAKPIQDLSYDQIADLLAKYPVDGLEATVRSGGQVDPAKIDEQLPRLHDALAKRSREFMILATNINSAKNSETESVLRLASKLGIRHFRMGYFRYKLDQPILPQLETFARDAKELAAYCGSLGMTALYQNHAGNNYVGAAMFDLVEVMKGIPVSQMAIAMDIRHTTIEATSSWPLLYAVAKPHLGGVFVKDAIFERGKVIDVDLGQGKAAKALFQTMQKDGLPSVLSLHTEQIDHADPTLLDQRLTAIGRDVATLVSWLDN